MESEPMPRQAASKVDTKNLSPPERKGKCKAIKWQIQETEYLVRLNTPSLLQAMLRGWSSFPQWA